MSELVDDWASVGEIADKVMRSSDPFYSSEEWRALRYRALKLYRGCCHCCGRRASWNVELQVDHIKPRSKYPELALDLSNLQILCKDCNFGKGAHDETDWRGRAA